MTAPDWLTESQRAAWDRGAAAAAAALADTPPRTTVDVSIDTGGGQRRVIAWCLATQQPADRCPCDDHAGVLIEDPVDVADDITSLLAANRAQLDAHAAAGAVL